MSTVHRLLGAAAAVLSSLAAVPATAGAATASTTSSNWAGYAVTSQGSSQAVRFRRVTGTWVVPSGSCTRGSPSYSAAWIGVGGFDETSTALEQIGTEFDCKGSGRASYSAWYELVPAASLADASAHAAERMRGQSCEQRQQDPELDFSAQQEDAPLAICPAKPRKS